ncbi:MAG: translation initiation factor IF-2 [Patescibacteria group bacterium]|nr:translation initiation factor IF-2 [Patescibacteria group bacterium]MDE2438844.1 translation initiation factor IF-2 [Patescibacteria group bacterium]
MNNHDGMISRPPIVVIMGHVDHGKTTLLDFIRKTNVAQREAGAITQSIGAYEIVHYTHESGEGRKITFIDTPGHEAFSQMRGRGARAADVAVLVVAADEGVKPQTKESLEQINATKTPFIIAFTKIDKPGSDVQRVRTQLSELGILVESWGGDIPEQEVSSLSGEGVNELLDLILLVADLQELKANPAAKGKGIVIETKRDSKRGITASLIIQDGTIHEKDFIATPSTQGKIKLIEDFKGTRITEASFSSPVLITGFEELPRVGEEWTCDEQQFSSHKQTVETTQHANEFLRKGKEVPEGHKLINVIIKADTYGSYEALETIVESLYKEGLSVQSISHGIGDITDSDIKLADTFKAVILGFHVKVKKEWSLLVDQLKVRVITSDIIYDTVTQFEAFLDKQVAGEKEYLGELEVLAWFSESKKGQLVGGKVLIGNVSTGKRIDLYRGTEKIGEGRITTLHTGKQEVKTVPQNKECGLIVQGAPRVEVGDLIKLY